jgi:streptogramin lyase
MRSRVVAASGALFLCVSGLAGAAEESFLTEFTIPTPNSGPAGITTGPDGNLWFAEYFADKIGRMTPSGPVFGV